MWKARLSRSESPESTADIALDPEDLATASRFPFREGPYFFETHTIYGVRDADG